MHQKHETLNAACLIVILLPMCTFKIRLPRVNKVILIPVFSLLQDARRMLNGRLKRRQEVQRVAATADGHLAFAAWQQKDSTVSTGKEGDVERNGRNHFCFFFPHMHLKLFSVHVMVLLCFYDSCKSASKTLVGTDAANKSKERSFLYKCTVCLVPPQHTVIGFSTSALDRWMEPAVLQEV